MREMGWSWTDLQATPTYVRRFTWDFIQLRRQAENDASERARQEMNTGA
ncbi:hypothetical protein [Pseudonocardia sp. T1-2H]